MDVSFTKYVDSSTPKLQEACAGGKFIDDVYIVVTNPSRNEQEYYIIKMDRVIVTSISTGGSGGEDRLTVNVTLNFGKVNVNYTPQKPDDSGVLAIFEYDLKKKKF